MIFSYPSFNLLFFQVMFFQSIILFLHCRKLIVFNQSIVFKSKIVGRCAKCKDIDEEQRCLSGRVDKIFSQVSMRSENRMNYKSRFKNNNSPFHITVQKRRRARRFDTPLRLAQPRNSSPLFSSVRVRSLIVQRLQRKHNRNHFTRWLTHNYAEDPLFLL